ncbi:uncharacterized protein [Aegilops tauschii subsp. strangulata]|uniref:uncharacterized protein n=1 Tax=Aegilops tauschii subsp. strangulata TaxID=200361 RepID=UPI00098B2CC7|nr:uncharacterized protein LOC109752327 [Aegilops tauschii subsp. strangulata]
MEEEASKSYTIYFQEHELVRKTTSAVLGRFQQNRSKKICLPIGRIKLEVEFGDEYNYRTEFLMFEVVKIKSPYHVIFGWLAYARFMAWPSYVYLKLKMPGPEGTITVDGHRRIALEYEEGDTAYAESAYAAEELKFYTSNVDPADMTPLKKPTTESDSPLMFKSAEDMKHVDFTPGDSSQ